MRQDVRHAPVGKRPYQSGVPDQLLGLILRAPVAGKEPIIGVDNLDRHQPLEQVLDV
jgi:hypothetical protein